MADEGLEPPRSGRMEASMSAVPTRRERSQPGHSQSSESTHVPCSFLQSEKSRVGRLWQPNDFEAQQRECVHSCQSAAQDI